MSDSCIDLDVFDEFLETMGEDFAADLALTFLEEAPAMLSDLRAAADAKDADAFRRAAHSIKSNANIFGAVTLAAVARDLELSGLDAGTESALSDLGAHLQQADEALRDLIDA